MKKRLILTGGTGLFGLNFFYKNKKKYQIHLYGNKKTIKNIKINPLNLIYKKKIFKEFNKVNPEIIVHAAAMTNINHCEKNKHLSKKINETSTKIITDFCIKKNVKLIFISTDNVFYNKKKFKNENIKTNSQNFYGRTKINSENYIKKKLKNYLILRTNFFGWGTTFRESFSDFIINNSRLKKISNLFTNVYFNPIYLETLIEIINLLIQKKINGIFNISSDERLSKYRFGKLIVKEFIITNEYIKKNKLVNKKKIIRPFEMTLNNNKLKKTINLKKISIFDEIKKLKKCKYKNKIQNLKTTITR